MYPKLSTGDNVSQSRNCAERVESFLYCVLAGQADGPANLGVMVAQSDWLFLSKGQVAAVEKADSVFSAGPRAVHSTNAERVLEDFLGAAGDRGLHYKSATPRADADVQEQPWDSNEGT